LNTEGARICTTKVDDADIPDFEFTKEEKNVIRVALESPALKGNVEDFGVFDVKEWY